MSTSNPETVRERARGAAVVAEIFDLFARYGGGSYGEDLSLESHMLQTAAHAQAMGAPPPLVAAALLHDIGHFLVLDAEAAAQAGVDLEHEAVGATWLSQAFGEDVTAPIALHVAAKRYLCAVEPGYFDALSDASRLSLVAQGGAFSEAEAAAFARRPAFEAAVLLRRCDDLGKDVSAQTRRVRDYEGLLIASMR